MKSERFFFQLAVKPRQNFNPQPVPSHTHRDCAESFQTMFTLAPPSLSMVLKPWCNKLRRGGNFSFSLSSHAQRQSTNHCRRTTVCSKTNPFLKPQNRVNFMSQNRSAARGLLSLSWAARKLETCLKTFTRKPPLNSDNKSGQADPRG